MLSKNNLEYAVLLCARNEETEIEESIIKTMNQTIPPKYVVVVDDGSKDNTYLILKKLQSKYSNLIIVKRRDRGFSALGTYLMADVYNSGIDVLMSFKDWSYLMIVSADTRLPSNYVKKVIHRMGIKYGVGSGIPKDKRKMRISQCPGSGRIIRRDVLKGLGGGYPRTYAWEDAVFNYSRYVGYKTGHFPDILFERTRPESKGHYRSYIGWGRGMKDNFRHPLAVLERILYVIIFSRDLNKALRLLVGYMAQPGMKDPPEWYKYTKNMHKQEIKKKIRRFLIIFKRIINKNI